MTGTVSLTMIVKNEAANLEACLNSANGQVNEIIIVDTGSTDNTREIARRYTDKLYSCPWKEDFSAARNFALEKATGEWILYLDADEQLVAGTGCIKDLINCHKHTEAYLLPLNNPISDSTGEYNRFYVLRLFKNNGRCRFQGKIHEQVVIEKNSVIEIAPGPVIQHKMQTAQERNRKRERNLTLLQRSYAEDRENAFLQYYLGVEWLMLGKPQRALPYLRQAYKNLSGKNLLFKSPALRYLIICLNSLDRLDEAVILCREAKQKYPDYTDIYYLGGVLLEEKQEYLQAIKWFSQAVKCGTPPVIYSHMHGTESFLAYYHLGYCHGILGQVDSAINYYEQALDTNSGYTYPAYCLFPLVLAQKGPAPALAYWKNKNFWHNQELAIIVANLFFIAGYPHLACRCLEGYESEENKSDTISFFLGKYNIFAGRLREGAEQLNRVSEKSFYPENQIYRIIALLLQGLYPESKAASLQLWRNPAARCEAWLLLTLTRLVEEGKPVNYPPKVRETELLEPALKVFEQCSRYLPEVRESGNSNYFRLLEGLESIIKNSSPRGYLTLLESLQKQSLLIRELFDYKFGASGDRV